MSFQFLNNMPLEEAKTQFTALLESAGSGPQRETVSVQKACGRVTYEAVYAHICAPHYNASAMDGIALRAKSTFGAGETTPVTLTKEQYEVVDTGDPVPEWCDAVVMVEDVVNGPDGTVILYAPAAPWQHIRQIGEDICAGEMILASNTVITPAAIGAMISGGILRVDVIKKPVVGIIPTGDEVVPPTDDPKSGDILEFNSSIFTGMVEQWGGVGKTYPIVPDNKELIKKTVEQAVSECDMVLLNAGSSAGREDFSAEVIGEVGEVFCHGVAIKPGKPAILAHKGEKAILGVPGYPVSGIIVIEEFLKPLMALALGKAPQESKYAEATLSKAVVSGLKYREFVRVRLGKVGGKLVAVPLNRGAGVVTSFVKADGIMEVPQGTEGFAAGEKVKVRLLRSAEELDNTLVIIGSHDPLLDEVADMLHRSDSTKFVSSSHVGSMGGVMAIRAGEAHAAGTHMLDEKTGEYNVSYIERYFPKGGVRLVECVGRTQGLMLAPGNPLGIREVADIAREGVRYVNRQKGSGTRILIDYLCKKQGIDTGKIYGYDREEFTHTSVAAQIASGTADAGMGIYSAAKLYGLDFVPVCIEQYDLLIGDESWDTPVVRKLIEILQSPAFKARLDQMGGYTADQPGRVRRHF